MDGEQATRTGIRQGQGGGGVAVQEERPYWTATRDLDGAIEHLDLTVAHLYDRLQPFMGAATEPSQPPGDTPQDTAKAQAVTRIEDAARAVRSIDSRLESLILGLLQI